MEQNHHNHHYNDCKKYDQGFVRAAKPNGPICTFWGSLQHVRGHRNHNWVLLCFVTKFVSSPRSTIFCRRVLSQSITDYHHYLLLPESNSEFLTYWVSSSLNMLWWPTAGASSWLLILMGSRLRHIFVLFEKDDDRAVQIFYYCERIKYHTGGLDWTVGKRPEFGNLFLLHLFLLVKPI